MVRSWSSVLSVASAINNEKIWSFQKSNHSKSGRSTPLTKSGRSTPVPTTDGSNGATPDQVEVPQPSAQSTTHTAAGGKSKRKDSKMDDYDYAEMLLEGGWCYFFHVNFDELRQVEQKKLHLFRYGIT